MILAEKFVFMHVPKTGGTFVTRVLRELLTPRKWDWRIHAVGRRYGIYLPGYWYQYRELDQHAMRRRIPPSHAHLPILSIVRNPYDIYVSEFTFNWWRENPQRWFGDVAAVEGEFGPLENFDFATFVRATLTCNRWSQTCRKSYPRLSPMGYCSTEWLHYHCLHPTEVVDNATQTEDFIERARAATAQITFLRTHSLNQDLHRFLSQLGFPAEKIDPILSRGKVHPGKPRRAEGDHWSNHYDEELRRLLRDRESLMFEMFPEFDETPASVPSS